MSDGRRSFIKGIGLFGALGAGYATAILQDRVTQVASTSVPNVDSNPVVEDISHLAPLGSTTLILTANNEPPPPPPSPMTFSDGSILTTTGGYYSMVSSTLHINGSGNPEQNNVKMSVGKDDRLWIEVDGKWRRVALDA
jgi:hypothetical protein